MKKISLLILLSFINTALFSQIKEFEKISKQKNEFAANTNEGLVGYSKFQLPNGLTVIISEDHSDPLVAINLSFRFGSGNDQSDRTGISFLAYQLMLSGTKHYNKGVYENLLSQYSGTFNSEITRDYTRFISLLPKNLFETALRMESDRIACFLDSLSEDKFNRVKGEVANYAMNKIFTQPYGLMETQGISSLYTFAYPYTWPVYGLPGHMENISFNDFSKYFLQWYGPNNAVLTITGDLNTEKALQLVNKYFGKISKSTLEKPHQNPYSDSPIAGVDNSLTESRFISYQHDFKNPMLRIIFPTVPKYNEKEFQLDCIIDFLAGDSNSLLIKTLKKNHLAESVKVYQHNSVLSGEFIIDIIAPIDTPLSKVKNMTLAVIDTLFLKLFNDPKYDDPSLSRYAFRDKLNFLKSIETIAGVANCLSVSELFYGNPNKLMMKLNQPVLYSFHQSLQFSLQEFIKGQPAVYISAIPFGKPDLEAAKDNFKPLNLNTIITHTEKSELIYRHMPSSFNKKTPKIKTVKDIKSPIGTIQKFTNGLRIITVPNTELPMATFKVYINLADADTKNYFYPFAPIFLELFKNKIYSFHQGEFIDLINRTGSKLDFYINGNTVIVEFQALKQDIFIIKEVFIQTFRDPEGIYLGAMSTLLPYLSDKWSFAKNPDLMAINTMNILLIDNPNRNMGSSDPDMVLKKTIADISLEFKKYLKPANTTIILTGNYEQAFLFDFIEQFKSWDLMPIPDIFQVPNTYNPKADSMQTSKEVNKQLYFVDYVDFKNPKMLIRYLGIPAVPEIKCFTRDFSEYAIQNKLNNSLFFHTGNFNAFDNQIIRNEKNTDFVLVADVPGSLLDSTTKNILTNIMTIKDLVITKNDLINYKKLYWYSNITGAENNSQKSDLVYFSCPDISDGKYYTILAKNLKSIKNSHINDLLQKNFDLDKIPVLVIGSKMLLSDQLSKLENFNQWKLKVIEIDQFGIKFN